MRKEASKTYYTREPKRKHGRNNFTSFERRKISESLFFLVFSRELRQHGRTALGENRRWNTLLKSNSVLGRSSPNHIFTFSRGSWFWLFRASNVFNDKHYFQPRPYLKHEEKRNIKIFFVLFCRCVVYGSIFEIPRDKFRVSNVVSLSFEANTPFFERNVASIDASDFNAWIEARAIIHRLRMDIALIITIL